MIRVMSWCNGSDDDNEDDDTDNEAGDDDICGGVTNYDSGS